MGGGVTQSKRHELEHNRKPPSHARGLPLATVSPSESYLVTLFRKLKPLGFESRR